MFWLASHTKILGAMALLKCIDMGLIGIDDSVLDHLPGLAQEEVYVTAPYSLATYRGEVSLTTLYLVDLILMTQAPLHNLELAILLFAISLLLQLEMPIL